MSGPAAQATPLRVWDLAHARAGDKGDTANIAVIAYDMAGYRHLAAHLTPERVMQAFAHLAQGPCRRYDLPRLLAFNFVIEHALDGGVTRSLRMDIHGKSLSSLLLSIELPPLWSGASQRWRRNTVARTGQAGPAKGYQPPATFAGARSTAPVLATNMRVPEAGPIAGEPRLTGGPMGTTTENGTDLFGLRVLVVEDQFLQADALRVELQVWGIEVVGPAPTVEQAMALLDREPPVDAALLDINLHERTVYPLASLLQERRIPFAFVTGMAKPALPERYRSVPLWSKPHDRWSIPRRMAELLQPPPRGPWRLRER